MGNAPDFTGQMFGMYTVIGAAEPTNSGKRRWLCRCDCGTERPVLECNLKSGHSTSCGCQRIQNLAGKRMGHLTVLERSDRYGSRGKRKVPLWKCLCDCGSITYKATDTLTNPSLSMCGDCAGRYSASRARNGAGYVEGTQLSRIQNPAQGSGNATGIRGVYYDAAHRKYRARLKFRGQMYNLGCYSSMEEAVQARRKAEEDIYGTFLMMRAPSSDAGS